MKLKIHREYQTSYHHKPRPLKIRGNSVQVIGNNVEGALRKLNQKLLRDGVLKKLNENTRFVSGSAKRRKRKQVAAMNARRKLHEMWKAEPKNNDDRNDRKILLV